MMSERSNRQWLEDLRGPEQERALADLRAWLVRGLTYALAKYSNVKPEHIEDFVQEALVKILGGLDSFRGESRFTTWAQKIAVNSALGELRRKRWHNVSLDEFQDAFGVDFVPDALVDRAAGPEKQTLQRAYLRDVQRIINEELTDKQRQALVAVRIHGMPLAEVARRMDSNRNALYKLLHDARKRLKRRMAAEGLSPQDVLAVFESS